MFLVAQTVLPSGLLDQKLSQAYAKVAQYPHLADAYIDLTLALLRKARETQDATYVAKASDSISRALAIDPASFDARKARVMVRLAAHRFSDALEEAQTLNKQVPDDNLLYGLICDAQFALGNYKEAEAAVQRMLDMRQVNAPGLARGARMREAMGYPDGAIEWWDTALRLTSATDVEERAHITTEIALVNLRIGRLDAADQYAERALTLVEGYPPAITALGRIRLAQDKPSEAADLLRKRHDLESAYWLAQADPSTGPEFERRARAAPNALLVLYLANHAKAADAVRIARQSLQTTHGMYDLDAYAWALYQTGDYPEARRQMDRALAYGLRDGDFFYHAGMIAEKNGDSAAAAGFFRKSIQANSASAAATASIQALGKETAK